MDATEISESSPRAALHRWKSTNIEGASHLASTIKARGRDTGLLTSPYEPIDSGRCPTSEGTVLGNLSVAFRDGGLPLPVLPSPAIAPYETLLEPEAWTGDRALPNEFVSDQEFEDDVSEEPSDTSKSQKRPPRPQNAWLLYRNDRLSLLAARDTKRPQGELSKAIAAAWRQEPEEVKKAYQQAAKQKQQEHKLKYPNYKFAPKSKDWNAPEKKKRKTRRVQRKRSPPLPAAECKEAHIRRPRSMQPLAAQDSKTSTITLEQTRPRANTAPAEPISVSPFAEILADSRASIRVIPPPLKIPAGPAPGPSSAPPAISYGSMPTGFDPSGSPFDHWRAFGPASAPSSRSGAGYLSSPGGSGLSTYFSSEDLPLSESGSVDWSVSPVMDDVELFGGSHGGFLSAPLLSRPRIVLSPGPASAPDQMGDFPESIAMQQTETVPGSSTMMTNTFWPPHSAPAHMSLGVASWHESNQMSVNGTVPLLDVAPSAPPRRVIQRPDSFTWRHVRVRRDEAEGMELGDLIQQMDESSHDYAR